MLVTVAPSQLQNTVTYTIGWSCPQNDSYSFAAPAEAPRRLCREGVPPHSQRIPHLPGPGSARPRTPRSNSLKGGRNPEWSGDTDEGRERGKEGASRPRRFWGHTRIRRVHDAQPRDQVPATGCDVPGGPHPSFPAPPCPPLPRRHRSQLGSRARRVPRRPLT